VQNRPLHNGAFRYDTAAEAWKQITTMTPLNRLGRPPPWGADQRWGDVERLESNIEAAQRLGETERWARRAKIIDVRRDPMGCCVSDFKRYFAPDVVHALVGLKGG